MTFKTSFHAPTKTFRRERTCELYISADSEVERALLPPLAAHRRGDADVVKQGGGAEALARVLARRGEQRCEGKSPKQTGDG